MDISNELEVWTIATDKTIVAILIMFDNLCRALRANESAKSVLHVCEVPLCRRTRHTCTNRVFSDMLIYLLISNTYICNI